MAIRGYGSTHYNGEVFFDNLLDRPLAGCFKDMSALCPVMQGGWGDDYVDNIA